ncbi:unnamed protein product [Rhizoctonia solani]|uniref:Transmembrane protein n=1 Tax=Rhizoctonia solani TaxID=456999 RepID=A0A8H2XQ03_9AGAM|nr:unnamed protein product [Rhizoctonia solani]
MRSFNRLLSTLALILSLGFIANALSSAHHSGLISYRQSTPDTYDGKTGHYQSNQRPHASSNDPPVHNKDTVPGQVWTLKGKLDTRLALLAKSTSIEDAEARAKDILFIIQAQSSHSTNLSENISAEARLDIARVVIKVFIDMISACARLSLKLGAPLVINLLADIDSAFSAYLSVLTNCVSGLGPILTNLAIHIDAGTIADLRIVGMTQCVKLLGLAGLV